MAKILVAGLNPAWQQVFRLPGFRSGSVNRAEAFASVASGKGLNAAKILARLGHDVSVLQILAGVNGWRCLEACADWGVGSLHVMTAGETRVSSSLVGERGAVTEIIAPFSAPETGLAERLLDQVEPAYDAVLVCGTLPAEVDEDFYARLLRGVSARIVLWDSVTGLTPEAVSRVDWLKVNAAEYAHLALPSGAKPALSLLVTDGPDAVSFRHHGASHRCVLPRLEAAVNPIGAGDTVTALLADGLLRSLDAQPAVARALAAGMASCLNLLPAEWDPEDAARLEGGIRWESA